MSGPAPQSTLICMFKKTDLATASVHMGVIMKRGAAQTAWPVAAKGVGVFWSSVCQSR